MMLQRCTIQSPSRRIQVQPPRLTKIILFLRCSRDLSKIKIQIPRDKIAKASTANLPLRDWVEVGEEEELGKEWGQCLFRDKE